MKQLYKVDEAGFYIEPVILFSRYEEEAVIITPDPYQDEEGNVIQPEPYEEVRQVPVYDIPEDLTAVEVAPPSFYAAKWTGTEWIEAGKAPDVEPSPPSFEQEIQGIKEENDGLKTSVAALEDMIVILTMPI